MKIPKNIILPQTQNIKDLESTIEAMKLLITTLNEFYRLLYGDIAQIEERLKALEP